MDRGVQQPPDILGPDGFAESIAVVGAGYVGLVTAACLAATGHRVTVVETDAHRREALMQGRLPIFEPGLDRLVTGTMRSGHLRVGDDLARVLPATTLVVIAVGTPEGEGGAADLRALNAVVGTLSASARPGTVVVVKSTVPPGTAARVARKLGQGPNPLPVVSCPEFLREGSALEDVRTASRVVIGGCDRRAMERTWSVMRVDGAECVFCDHTSAELIKYSSNAFLALKISFINEVANLCDAVGGDVDVVARGMGLDPRISPHFLRAGLGFGGSCFPKDVSALEATAQRSGHSFWLLKAALEVNQRQRTRFVHKLRDAVGGDLEDRRVAVLGVAFKPGTDDLRHAPSIAIISRLTELGAQVIAHDPVAMEAARQHLPGIELAPDPYTAMREADVVALVTEWPQYTAIDWATAATLVRRRVVVDGRNCLDAEQLTALGFAYHGMGRRSRTLSWSRRGGDPVRVAAENVA